jgi:hypothetical protein
VQFLMPFFLPHNFDKVHCDFLGSGGGQYRVVSGTTLAVGSWSEDCCEGVGYMLVVNIFHESFNPRGFPLLFRYLFLQQKSNSNQLILDFEGERRRDIPTLLPAALASGNLYDQGAWQVISWSGFRMFT